MGGSVLTVNPGSVLIINQQHLTVKGGSYCTTPFFESLTENITPEKHDPLPI